MAVVFDNNVVRINLSNTESIGSSIYNYSDLQKTKESSVSSTSSYFLATNLELSKKVLEYLDCDNTLFVVDIAKTKQYINDLDKILEKYDRDDFHGGLKDYYINKDYYKYNNEDFEIGFAKANIEEGSSRRSYLRFNNEDTFVKLFRGIIIAIFSSIVIEKRNGKNYIFPAIKEEIIGMAHEKVKEEFRNYMLNVKHLNENSVVQYLDVIDYTSKDAMDDGILDKSIYEYSNANDVRNILETLRQNDHFNTITFKRNHINTAAVGNFINYLDYKNSNNMIPQVPAEKMACEEINVLSDSIAELENNVSSLIDKLKLASNNSEKTNITKEIIRNCYEMLNHYR